MSKYDELKRLAEEVKMSAAGTWTLQTGCSWRRIGTEFGDGNVLRPCTHQHDGWPDLSAAPYVLEYLIAAQPVAIFELIEEVEVLREKTAELNLDASRYCYLATTTWSDEVTDALCTSDKDQIDQAIDAELMRASA